jgi:hypothetical protein
VKWIVGEMNCRWNELSVKWLSVKWLSVKWIWSNNTSLIKGLFKFSKIKKKNIDFNNDYNSNSGNSGSNSQQEHKSHPLAYRSSRILDDEIAKSKNLKSNDSLISDLDINNFN